jgi:diacylglycerol kinase family enzyme
LGSGNGFARELKLYGSVKRAIQYINQGKTKRLDSGKMNNEFFINLCGIGFDAHVGSLFAGSSKRGLQTYLQIIWRELIHFKAQAVEITTETESINASIFMASICNGPQFGNNAFIAPNAQLDDALFDMTLIHEFPKWKTPFIAACILFRKIHWVKEIQQIKCKQIQINRAEPGFVNIDGEPLWMQKELVIELNAQSIEIICP